MLWRTLLPLLAAMWPMMAAGQPEITCLPQEKGAMELVALRPNFLRFRAQWVVSTLASVTLNSVFLKELANHHS